MRITKQFTNRENQSLDKYLQEIGKEKLIKVDERSNRHNLTKMDFRIISIGELVRKRF